jgi:hypothetical protein
VIGLVGMVIGFILAMAMVSAVAVPLTASDFLNAAAQRKTMVVVLSGDTLCVEVRRCP